MSRICVKNLPKHVAEDRLRDFFSQKGEVTDAKLMRTKDGKSRQFGFVGFRSEKEAEEALKFFNKSFMDTCRITCEIAQKVGDPNMPRPWSRHSLKKQQKLTEERKQIDGPKRSSIKISEEKKKENENDDPQLKEFLEVMQPRVKSKLWANDTSAVPPYEQNQIASDKIQVKGKAKNKNSSSKLDEIDGSEISEAVQSLNLAPAEVVSDMDYFRSRVKTEWSDSESDTDDEDHEDEGFNEDHQNSSINQDIQEEDQRELDASKENDSEEANDESESDMIDEADQSSKNVDEKEVLETGRLFVRNLPYTATEDELEEHFSKYGNVSRVHLVVDKDTKRSKGYAYVLYMLPESAARALDELDNSIFQGRLMHVMPAKHKTTPLNQETDTPANQSKTFKQKREEERKASEASGNTRAWNTLFMRPDTVCQYPSDIYNPLIVS